MDNVFTVNELIYGFAEVIENLDEQISDLQRLMTRMVIREVYTAKDTAEA